MWEAIITDTSQVKQIESKIEQITEVLSYHLSNENSLIDGRTGPLLYFNYLSKYRNSNIYDVHIQKLTEEVFSSINNGFIDPSYSCGIGGISFVLSHLKQEGFVDFDESFDELIPFLGEKMIECSKENNFDFLHGAQGILLSMLKSNNELSERYIYQFFDLLVKNGDKEKGRNIKWKSSIDLSDGKSLIYNLGLAHGISSAIVLLCLLLEKSKIEKHQKIILILSRAINYLLSTNYSKNENSLSLFPGYVHLNGVKSTISRLSWCYGDLSVAVALKKAGETLRRKELIQQAVEIIHHSAKRKNLNTDCLTDPGFCHGAIGVSHIFNRFYQSTKNEEFKTASVYWLNETLEMSVYEEGLAGFNTLESFDGRENLTGLLEGIAGIGLVLISSVSKIEPKWDSCFLLS